MCHAQGLPGSEVPRIATARLPSGSDYVVLRGEASSRLAYGDAVATTVTSNVCAEVLLVSVGASKLR